MAFSDSMFLFEIVVEELKSYIDCKEFYITSRFADVFTLNLKDPNELDTLLPKLKMKKAEKKTKIRKKTSQKPGKEGTVQSGQSILLASNITALITNMKNFPIELSLFSKDDPDNKLGCTHIPWSPVYIDYLYKSRVKPDETPARVSGSYNIYDDLTSKRMATIRINIKLTYLKNKMTSSFRSMSDQNRNTFIYTGFNSKPTSILSTMKERPVNIKEDVGVIKTCYSGKRKMKTASKTKTAKKKDNELLTLREANENIDSNIDHTNNDRKCELQISRLSLVKSDTDLNKNRHIEVIKTKSCTSTNKEYNISSYIFGDANMPLPKQVYTVGYFTVENDFNKDSSSGPTSTKGQSSDKSDAPKGRYKFRICDRECPSRKADETCNESMCSLDLPEEAADLITVSKCKQIDCNERKFKEMPTPPDDRILVDLSNLNRDCCVNETVEQVVGGMKAKMKFDEEACLCSCECTFGFVKKTTYCGICGGYENVGEDVSKKTPNAPFPCPVFHKLIDRNRLKTCSTSGSDSKRKGDDSLKNFKAGSKPASAKSAGDKNAESEKDSKKGKKKKKDDRFKFNYGYTAAQIGHSNCTGPCTGTLGSVPKNMGWLWTAEDVPGIKFRPMWKPGATNKHVVRLLRMAKNPGEVLAKKKRKEAGKKKRPLKRPLLTVQKKEGEYTVTMETMKMYPKQRVINQYPYEDKPVVTYTIGRTEEENRERKKKKEREQRRLERDQRQFIQSAFRDMCKEICLKTYQQALGILPDTEDPDCPCYPKYSIEDKANLDRSCSCSEDNASIGSDTDSDEWIVEFTPPSATFDPKFKGKKVIKADNSSQYTYLDYRVKLNDRYGNPVPRFFKGPDGKQQCSDLGGFWSPEHKWLEINIDGYIAPDGRWAPMSFIGPSGEQVDCDNGKFQTSNAKWLTVGVDGFIDCVGKWKFYPKPRGGVPSLKKRRVESKKKGSGDKADDKTTPYQGSETTWSCFGDAKPKDLSRMGILGHGHDKKLLLATLQKMLAHGEDVKIPQPSVVPRRPPSKNSKGRRKMGSPEAYNSRTYFLERQRCRHPMPSDKGVVAVDDEGNKTYFRIKDYKNKRPNERLADLTGQGISLSSFHVPCFHSFINTELMKKQQYERLMAMSQLCAKSVKSKCVSTQI